MKLGEITVFYAVRTKQLPGIKIPEWHIQGTFNLGHLFTGKYFKYNNINKRNCNCIQKVILDCTS